MPDGKCVAGQPQVSVRIGDQRVEGCTGLLLLATVSDQTNKKVNEIDEKTDRILLKLEGFEVAPNGARIKTAAASGSGITAAIGAAALGAWTWWKSKHGGQ